MPTLASLLGIEAPEGQRGTDLAPHVRDAAAEPVQDEVLFSFDDMHAGTGLVPEVLPGAPGRIRCIRERRFKYARYFDAEDRHPPECEMYDLSQDPYELENLAHPEHPRYGDPGVRRERDRLTAKLERIEQDLARATSG
jgi:arylsulfatase A-like enzyme